MDAETREKLGHSSDRRTLVNFDKPEINLAIGDQYVDGTTYHNDLRQPVSSDVLTTIIWVNIFLR